ncbi:MAG: ATP-dependent DNA ligase [Polyangiaceae bacterium]|nr:ATP-dependent DNA ligase [Polyangiaceae bacterium]
MRASAEEATLADLVATSKRVASTRARNAKIATIADYLATLDGRAAALASLYLSGELPQGKIGVGWSMVAEARGGAVSETSSLHLADVDRAFTSLASASGSGSIRARREGLARLIAMATADERDFLAALVIGEVRQGALASLIGEALARAHAVAPSDVRRAVMVAGSVGEVARVLAEDGLRGLCRFAVAPFNPVLPMLAQVADDVSSAIADLGEASFEWKLDGARVQIHREDDVIRVFSRGGADVTPAVPEVVELARALPVRRCILDGEAIALRPGGRPHPFQTTMRRFGRDKADDASRAALPLSAFVFDTLLVDDQLLLDAPARDRFEVLSSIIPAESRVPRIVTADPVEAQAFLDGAFAAGHEGVMAKSLASAYDAGNRGAAWLKLKKVHTLELVVLAAEWGSGRRKGWLSNLHLGARDPVRGFAMLGKTFKGMTDEVLAWQTKEFLAREVRRDGHIVYVRPELVAEFAFSDVMMSTQYPAGLSLRLARLVRYRPDRTAADAATIEDVRVIAIKDGVVE